MGRFTECKTKVLFQGEWEEWPDVGCVIDVLVEHGGAEKHFLTQEDSQRAVGISVGPFENHPDDDPCQDYCLITLKNPHEFKLAPKASFQGLADTLNIGA